MGRRRTSHRPPSNRDYRQPAAGAGSQTLPPSLPRHQMLAICGLLLLMMGLVFSQTVRYEFVNYDDDKYAFENPPVMHGLTAAGFTWAFTNRAVYWGPLTWLSLMLDSQLYGPNAAGYHLTNVLLHAATAVVLFLVLHRMTGRVWAAALATMLFAVHPLRVESVAWVTERKDVLSGLFFTLTLAAYLGYVRHPFSLLRYLAVMIFFALGLMSKASLVPLPALLLLLDYWPLGRFGGDPRPPPSLPRGKGETFLNGTNSWKTWLRQFPWRLVIEKLPLLALVAGSCAVTVWSQSEALVSVDTFSWGWRIGSALISYVAYVGQFFYPVGLAAVYPRSDTHLSAARIVAALLVLLGITVAALLTRRKCPYLLVGWAWYLGMLLPMIGLVQFGAQAMADRFTYLPQIGLCVALAWSAADVCRLSTYCRSVGGLISALVLAVAMGAAWRQTTFWRDSECLWRHTLACTSRNGLAHYDLALALVSQGRLDEAIAQYRKALEIKPDDVNSLNNMAIVFVGRGQFGEAITHYREALKIDPHSAQLRYNMGYALACQGRLEEAVPQYQKALELDPRCAIAHHKYGIILAHWGRYAEALAQYRSALKLQPHYGECQFFLAWLLATCPVASLRNGEEAVEHARQVDQLCAGKDPLALDCLAAAYAEAGRFPEAITTARRALAVAIEQNKRALASEVRARIALYEARKPFRLSSSPGHGPKTK